MSVIFLDRRVAIRIDRVSSTFGNFLIARPENPEHCLARRLRNAHIGRRLPKKMKGEIHYG
jgi:hypothetical protein